MVDGWSRRTLGVVYIMFQVVTYGTSYKPNMKALPLFRLRFFFVCVLIFAFLFTFSFLFAFCFFVCVFFFYLRFEFFNLHFFCSRFLLFV